MSTNIENAIKLASHVFEMAKFQDEENVSKIKELNQNLEKTVGVSALTFYSKSLLDLLNEIKDNGVH